MYQHSLERDYMHQYPLLSDDSIYVSDAGTSLKIPWMQNLKLSILVVCHVKDITCMNTCCLLMIGSIYAMPGSLTKYLIFI